jgi:hypothetical protein
MLFQYLQGLQRFSYPHKLMKSQKLYGVSQKYKEYEYIIVLDDDLVFCKSVDLYVICQEYFSSRYLISSSFDGTDKVAIRAAEVCKRFFRNYPNFQRLENTKLLWFNQPCIYRSEDIPDFFLKTGLDRWMPQLTYLDFDYIIYMYYLILFDGFEVRDSGIKAAISASEIVSNGSFEVLNNNYKDMKWYCLSEYMQKFLPNDCTFITLHYDREPRTRKYMKRNPKWFIYACMYKMSMILMNKCQKIKLTYYRKDKE